MDQEDFEKEAKIEKDYQEVKEWEESESEEKFDTWKLKKLINIRFIEAIIISVAITLIILKFL